jgi:hypothetical protein
MVQVAILQELLVLQLLHRLLLTQLKITKHDPVAKYTKWFVCGRDIY